MVSSCDITTTGNESRCSYWQWVPVEITLTLNQINLSPMLYLGHTKYVEGYIISKRLEAYIILTLWWISFILGMLVYVGPKIYSILPLCTTPWGQSHELKLLNPNAQAFQVPPMVLVYDWRVGLFMCNKFCVQVLVVYIIKTLWRI